MNNEMVEIQPGVLTTNEGTTLVVEKNYSIGRTPVTVSQWREFVGESKYPWGENFEAEPNCPITRVSFFDAVCFCAYYNLRLPTELEWEYACRAGSVGDYCCNLDQLKEYAVYNCHKLVNVVYSRHKLVNVATKKPNNFGLYDMHGLVWEWCSSRYYKATNPIRVVRGGGSNDSARGLRSAYRNGSLPGHRYDDMGFRVSK